MSDPGSLLERLPMGAAVVAEDRLLAANAAFAAILRASPAQVAGTTLPALLAPEDLAALRAADVPGEAPTWTAVAGLSPADRAPWLGQLAVGAPLGGDGPSGRIALLLPDRPALAVAGSPAPDEAGAAGTEGRRGPTSPWDRFELDRILSHDARGGLRGTKSFLTLLQREAGEGLAGQGADYLQTAAAAAARTDTMVERLVTLLRLSVRPVTVAPVAVEALLAEAVARSGADLPGEEPTLVAGSLPTVWADRELLTGALAELVTNARKFAAGPVNVRVTSIPAGRWVHLLVADDGPGVPPDLAEDAFAPYRLLQPKGRFPGVGMGLPWVRESLRVQGGGCWIDPGEGGSTVVRLRLALARA